MENRKTSSITETYNKVAQKFLLSHEQLQRASLISYLSARKKSLMNERFEILSRYRVTDVNEMEEKIKQGALAEHPSWEDLIDLRNIGAEIQGVADDIDSL